MSCRVSVSRSACLTCVAAGSDDLPWPRSSSMDIDTDKTDEAVLALLYLTLHDGVRAWKGHDWDALDRLYRKGMIENTVGKEIGRACVGKECRTRRWEGE